MNLNKELLKNLEILCKSCKSTRKKILLIEIENKELQKTFKNISEKKSIIYHCEKCNETSIGLSF